MLPYIMANYNGSLEAVDCHIHSDIHGVGLVGCELQVSLSVFQQVSQEIVVAGADTCASSLALKGFWFGRVTSAFVALLTLLYFLR